MLIVTGIHLQVRVSLLSYMDLNTFLEGEIAIWGINREKAAAIGSQRAHPWAPVATVGQVLLAPEEPGWLSWPGCWFCKVLCCCEDFLLFYCVPRVPQLWAFPCYFYTRFPSGLLSALVPFPSSSPSTHPPVHLIWAHSVHHSRKISH